MNILMAFAVTLFVGQNSFADELKNGESVNVSYGGSQYTPDMSCEVRRSFTGNIEFSMNLSESLPCDSYFSTWDRQSKSEVIFTKLNKESASNFPNFNSTFTCQDKASSTTKNTCGVAFWQIHGDTSAVRTCNAKKDESFGTSSTCLALQVCQAGFLNYAEDQHKRWPMIVDDENIQSTQKQLHILWNRFACK